MKGRFTAVVYGEFEASRSRPALIAVLLGTVALVSWLATVLLELAVAAGGFAVAVAGVCWLLSRRPDRDSELLAERIRAMQAEAAAVRPVPQEVHYHLHLPPGTTAADALAALPHRDAAAIEGD